MLLFSCSISRCMTLHSEVLLDQITRTFLKPIILFFEKSFLIPKTEQSCVIYSDTTKNFISASKWTQNTNKNVEFKSSWHKFVIIVDS